MTSDDLQQVQQMIDAAINKNAEGAQYTVSPIPYHVHNGTDSPQVPGENLSLLDSTINNSSSVRHGFLPKLSGTSTDYFAGNGSFTALPSPPSTFPLSLISTTFETAGRFILGGTLSPTFNTTGMNFGHVRSGGNATSDWQVNQAGSGRNIFCGSPFLMGTLDYYSFAQSSADGDIYIGLGEIGWSSSAGTYTDDHAGFKISMNGTNVIVYATTADGTTETAVQMDNFGPGTGEEFNFYLKVHGNSGVTSVDFYFRHGTNAWSSVTTISTHLPRISGSGGGGFQSIRFASFAEGGSGAIDLRWQGATFGH